MKRKVTKIVLSGGPCGVKTSAFNQILENFSALSYQVFAFPERTHALTINGLSMLQFRVLTTKNK